LQPSVPPQRTPHFTALPRSLARLFQPLTRSQAQLLDGPAPIRSDVGSRRRHPRGPRKRAKKRTPPGTVHAGSEKIRQRPTLPHGFPRSTIGSGGLNFRVRDGNGWDPSDIATGMLEGAARSTKTQHPKYETEIAFCQEAVTLPDSASCAWASTLTSSLLRRQACKR
jgi:hypothetical protein